MTANQRSGHSVRLMLVYSDTGHGHKSSADGLTESMIRSRREANSPTVHITHIDIYRLTGVFLFRGAEQYYELLCRHAKWLYNLLFRVTDNRVIKRLIAKIIVTLYGQRIGKLIKEADPDVIVVLHPLFVADVLCEVRDRSTGGWKVISFVTDLGIAHAGWVAASVDSAIFVCGGQIEKLRSQGCLSPKSRALMARAPVRAAFAESDPLLDSKVRAALGLKPPYLLYIAGIQPTRLLVRQVEYLTREFGDLQIVVIGPASAKAIRNLRRIDNQTLHLQGLSSAEMAAVMRNAEVVAGKAGPAIMAEAASVHARFIPTAEMGRQETGNALVGRSLYGADAVPWWGETAIRHHPSRKTRDQMGLADHVVMGDAEVYDLLMKE